MDMNYKIADGKIYMYKVCETTPNDVVSKIEEVKQKVQPYLNGIATCDEQIKRQEEQKNAYRLSIQNILTEFTTNNPLADVVAPDWKDGLLGF